MPNSINISGLDIPELLYRLFHLAIIATEWKGSTDMMLLHAQKVCRGTTAEDDSKKRHEYIIRELPNRTEQGKITFTTIPITKKSSAYLGITIDNGFMCCGSYDKKNAVLGLDLGTAQSIVNKLRAGEPAATYNSPYEEPPKYVKKLIDALAEKKRTPPPNTQMNRAHISEFSSPKIDSPIVD